MGLVTVVTVDPMVEVVVAAIECAAPFNEVLEATRAAVGSRSLAAA